MRNLNDVIKEGNTGENVTHSWDFYSCIIISWKHFGYNTSSITGRGGDMFPGPARPLLTRRSMAPPPGQPGEARPLPPGSGLPGQARRTAGVPRPRDCREHSARTHSTTTLLTSGLVPLCFGIFKKNCKIAGSNGVKRAPSCSRVRRGHRSRADPQDCRHFPPPSATACCNSQQCPQLAAWEQKGSPNQRCMQHVPYTAICVCVCLCSSFWKDFPISVSLNSSPECCLWALWGQKTLEGLIFKDLRAVQDRAGTVSPTTDSILSSPPVVHGRNLRAKESSGATGLQPYHRALTPRCPSDWTPCRDPTLPRALQFEFGRSEKQRATNLITVAANKARTIPGHSGL